MNGTVNASCNTCHGFPPPPGAVDGVNAVHPASATSCATCHGDTLAAGTHMNNRVDAPGVSCNGCHGAPPPSPHPPATLAQCAGCHPTSVTAAGAVISERADGTHMNGAVNASCTNCHGYPPANHARNFGADVSNCANCHGDTLGAGTHMNGSVNLRLESCIACHQAPPPRPHYPAAQTFQACARCHSQSVDANGLRFGPPDANGVRVSLAHMNGTKNHDCAICHGYPPAASIDNHPQNPDCVGCHGNNIANNTHLNGRVDFAPTP
jgi:hypothetical protein